MDKFNEQGLELNVEMYAADEDSRDRETRELLDLFDYADSYRKNFEDDEIKFWQQYEGYREQIPGQSSLHIPRTYELLDTLRAQIVQALTQSRPYIEFVPLYKRPEELMRAEELEKKAELAAGLVDNQLEKNQWEIKAYQFVTDYLVSHVAIMGVGWRHEVETVRKRREIPMVIPEMLEGFQAELPDVEKIYEIVEEEEVIWDDNELVNIDFFDFWPDPRAQECTPDANRFVFIREWMTWNDLMDYLRMLEEQQIGTVFQLDREEISRYGRTDMNAAEERNRYGVYDQDGSENMDSDRLKLYEVLHYWEADKHAVLVNRYALAYSGPNPYWRHRKIPIVTACYEPVRGQFYGRPATKILEHLQAELDTHRNQRIDNVSMILNRMWLRTDPSIPDSALVSKPNNIIDTTRPDGVIPLTTQDITASAYQEEAIIKADMETALPTPPITRGIGAERTATNAKLNNDNAFTRYSVKLKLFECMGIKRLAYLMDLNNQQFIEEPRLAKFADQEGAMAWRMVDVGDTFGEHDYRPATANIDPTTNKEIKRQQLMQLFPIAAQDRFVDQYKLRKMLFKAFDKDFLDILRPEQEVMAEMQQQQLIAQMIQQQQAQAQAQQQQQADETHEMDMVQRGISAAQQLADMFGGGDNA